MKSKIAVILTILLLFALAGCNNTPQTEKMPEPFSFSESNEQTSESDTLPAAEETKEAILLFLLFLFFLLIQFCPL